MACERNIKGLTTWFVTAAILLQPGCSTSVRTDQSLLDMRNMLEGRGYRITEYEWGSRHGDRIKGTCPATASQEAAEGHTEYRTEIWLRERDQHRYADIYSESRRGNDLPLTGIFVQDQAEQIRISEAIMALEELKDSRR